MSQTNAAFSKQEQREQKRLAVLQTGARLFAEKGFDRTSLDDIAAELNVSKRTLYYYVKSKDEILFECRQRASLYLHEAIKDAGQSVSPQSALVRLENFFQIYAQVLSNDFGACLVRCQNEGLSPKSKSVLTKGLKNVDSAVRRLIQEGIDDGSINECDPKFTAAAMFGAFNWLPYWHPEGGSEVYSDIAKKYLRTFLLGLQRNG